MADDNVRRRLVIERAKAIGPLIVDHDIGNTQASKHALCLILAQPYHARDACHWRLRWWRRRRRLGLRLWRWLLLGL